MNDKRPKRIPVDDPEGQQSLTFILPQWNTAMGFSCARDYADEHAHFTCGCPRCLRKIGLTMIFHQEDWREDGDCREHWRRRIVSQKTAGYAKHLVIPGYD
jgi:hypothetical protein